MLEMHSFVATVNPIRVICSYIRIPGQTEYQGILHLGRSLHQLDLFYKNTHQEEDSLNCSQKFFFFINSPPQLPYLAAFAAAAAAAAAWYPPPAPPPASVWLPIPVEIL